MEPNATEPDHVEHTETQPDTSESEPLGESFQCVQTTSRRHDRTERELKETTGSYHDTLADEHKSVDGLVDTGEVRRKFCRVSYFLHRCGLVKERKDDDLQRPEKESKDEAPAHQAVHDRLGCMEATRGLTRLGIVLFDELVRNDRLCDRRKSKQDDTTDLECLDGQCMSGGCYSCFINRLCHPRHCQERKVQREIPQLQGRASLEQRLELLPPRKPENLAQTDHLFSSHNDQV